MPASGYPFIAHDEAFAAVIGDKPRLAKVVETDAHEGPVYVAGEDALYFTSLPRPTDMPAPGSRSVAIRRLALDGDRFPLSPEHLSTVGEPANMANGMALDSEGRLLICEQGTRFEPGRISRLDPRAGSVESVVEQWSGLRLNSPNDVVCKSDGTIWFTDPSYGFLQGFKGAPQVGDYVYRYDPRTDRLNVVADGFDKPNGLAFSPDERVLYIGDSGYVHGPNDYAASRPHHVIAFDVLNERHLTNARLFAVITPGFPDGIKVDTAGRVYVSAANGVRVFSPAGDLLGEIFLPGAVNFTFGGRHNTTLFITADTAIWAASLHATGAQQRPTEHRVVAAARS
jgi:gluconolactonase